MPLDFWSKQREIDKNQVTTYQFWPRNVYISVLLLLWIKRLPIQLEKHLDKWGKYLLSYCKHFLSHKKAVWSSQASENFLNL